MAKSKKEKTKMMTNRTLFVTVMMLFLLPWCMGLGGAPEDEDLHVSEEVEIKKEKQETGREAEKAPESESGDTEAKEQKEQEKQDDASAGRDSEPEASPEDMELGALMLDEQEALYGNEERYYTRKGRVDPFEPFIQRESSENSQDQEGQEVERREPQTPLEKIALSQLKLTAILRVSEEGRSMGMVEDKDGRGYVVREGTYIGENGGQVEEVLRDRIIIQEKYKDVFGKIAVREIEKKIQN